MIFPNNGDFKLVKFDGSLFLKNHCAIKKKMTAEGT